MKVILNPGRQDAGANLPPLLRQAATAHQAGDYHNAARHYREFLAANPHHPTALQLLGLLYSQRGEYEPAIQYMTESLRIFPEQAEVANNLANAYSRSGRLEEALESYSRAVEINPAYADAWRNLGLCRLKLGQPGDAARAFRRCLDIQPGDAAAWLGLGNVLKQLKDIEQAAACYERALSLQPGYPEAHHNLGVSLRMLGRAGEAIGHFRSAGEQGLDRAELFQNLARALVDAGAIDAAITAFKGALQRDPEDIDSHRDLNALLWEQERTDEHLDSYRRVLRRHPGAEPLVRAYGVALCQIEDFARAEQVFRQGLERLPDSSELKSLLAFSLEGQERWEDALVMHAAAVATPGSTPNHRISYARALLARGRPDEALPQAQAAATRAPSDQRALAYLGLCWRMLGDPRDQVLNDYENLVRVFDVPVPEPYTDVAEFNHDLGRLLESLHTARRHPLEQTLRGGTRTHGDLFSRREPEITGLVSALTHCIREYCSRLPRHPDHPLLARITGAFSFSDSWSVRLQPGGFHSNHTHPLGWISSAYYVDIPEEISASDVHGGGIRFGQPDIDIGAHGAARRIIQPRAGQLVLFPSYMWHGTVPHTAGKPRLTVAFDVLPTGAGSAQAV